MPVFTLLAHAALLAQLVDPYPFTVGETLRYEARLGFVPIGTASASVTRMDHERGVETFVFAATGEGGPPGGRLRYEMTSWVGKAPFNSLRFHRRTIQGKSINEYRFQIVPDSARFHIEGKTGAWAAPRDPLDELAFLYYLRTVTLKVGRNYQVSRYFQTSYNPIRIRVTGRETVTLGSGREVNCLAIEITSRDNMLRLWLTDDRQRLPAQLDIPMFFGRVRLRLV